MLRPRMSERAVGTFEVALAPVSTDETEVDASIGLLSIDKQFEGDLTGKSVGYMLAVSTDTPGSAGYVAMERVDGTLHGRRGSFALQHRGVMSGGESDLTITVVPASGSDELVGLAGSMTIDIVDGRHEYTFDYALEQ
jgi:hypothetical protein